MRAALVTGLHFAQADCAVCLPLPYSVVVALAELESQGFVSRRPDESDKRRTLLELTDAGSRVLADDRRRREGWLANAIEDDFSAAERRSSIERWRCWRG